MPLPAVQDQQLAAALSRSESLGSLLQKVRESQLRLQALADLLPTALAGSIRAGPVDDTQWVLLVDHNAAAAKLRQMLPTLTEALTAAGWAERTIRIKVLPRA
ncbi:MAG TPA: DciA family protein [Rubrivivax sp.]|nr:DciA family protein [Rubrivivax sp.]